MKIAGAWSGHDCSYYISNNGIPLVHAEYERYLREKEPPGDSIALMLGEHENCEDIVHLATCHPYNKITDYQESFVKIDNIIKKNGGQIHVLGHHQTHAANTFFSSNFENALILTIDGGGLDRIGNNIVPTACTVWVGSGNKIKHIHTFPINSVNIGGVWTRTTRYIFKLHNVD